jgi:hypothetical protein
VQAGIRTCGCQTPPRRACDLCSDGAFLACSRQCLDLHQRQAHASESGAGTRARAAVAAINRRTRDTWQPYAGHRDRLARLALAVQRGEGLCVLGAGNADDVDLPSLVKGFGEVHLVDLDGEALERARARQPATTQARVVAHAGYDLTGCLDRIDDWGEQPPGDEELAALAADTASSVAGAIGRSFDVVLSACLLSQLAIPPQRTLVASKPQWERLLDALTRVHVRTMAALLRSEGTGVLAFDVLTSEDAPELRAATSTAVPPEIGFAVEQKIRAGTLTPQPDPRRIFSLLQEPPTAALLERVQGIEPWLWDTGDARLLVYAYLFRRL